jgi:molybdopterin-guanine dinucleotide biosynthesis protein A
VHSSALSGRKRSSCNDLAAERKVEAPPVYHRPMGASPDLAAFVLAGGKSTRMGRDKAFVEFEGRTLLARALDVARSVTSEVWIVGSREKFAPFAPVVEDVFSECGPLAGIHAALQSSRSKLNLMLSVDTPFITSKLLQYLISQARASQEAQVVVPRANGRPQPLCAIYRGEFYKVAEKALNTGRNKIGALFDEVRTKVIEENELDTAGFSSGMFRNLNTPEEITAQERGDSFAKNSSGSLI